MSFQTMFQKMIDDEGVQMRIKRSETQMTLGKLIGVLEAMPAGAEVANLNSADSYRGYYEDLAFARENGTRPAADLLRECNLAIGREFDGYKGGTYRMDSLTPLWIAPYGCCGLKLMALYEGGMIETKDDE